MTDREHDLILYGATGFTGRLVAEHLLANAPADLRWAMAGRSLDKLKRVADQVGADVPLVVADSQDAASLRSMAGSTTVVCTTVGPYATFGSDVVAACVEAGTDYCDLTGEVQWIRRMIDAHQHRAEETGARIVHTCGFDSIPSDMGVWFAQQQMHELHGVYSPRVKGGVKAARGGASGGTIDSLLNVMDEASSDPAVRKVLFDPYALQPEGQRSGPRRTDAVNPSHDDDLDAWTGPWVMAAINTRVVRRTNALLGNPWGTDFDYTETLMTGHGPLGAAKAGLLAGGMGVGLAAMAVPPLRRLAQRFLPAAGEGPDAEARDKGFFDIRFHAAHPTDRNLDVRVKVTGDRDPGYGSTAKMLGQSALCLAAGESTVGGGHWTPASAMGQALLDRLRSDAGLTFELL